MSKDNDAAAYRKWDDQRIKETAERDRTLSEDTSVKIWIKIYFKDGRYQKFPDECLNWDTAKNLTGILVRNGFPIEEKHAFTFIPPHAIERIIITKRDTSEERGDF